MQAARRNRSEHQGLSATLNFRSTIIHRLGSFSPLTVNSQTEIPRSSHVRQWAIQIDM
jgi:hypothetical protein